MIINVNPRGGMMPPPDFQCDGWRFVFDRWDGQRVQSVSEALAFYDPIVSQLTQRRRTVVLVLNQQSWGDGGVTPWAGGQPWDVYASEFGAMAAQVAQRWGANVRYQIGNEHDIVGESSIYWRPEAYATVLRAAVNAIRGVARDAVIYSHGHASSAAGVVRYWRAVVNAYGSTPPISAVAVHPYGQYVGAVPAISTGWFGDLAQYWRTVETIGAPLVVTEIGVSEPNGFPEREWAAIAAYMRSVHGFLSGRAALIAWFAWHDGMRGAGIVDVNSRPKRPIYDTFTSLQSSTPANSVTVAVAAANVRELPTTGSAPIAQARRGEWLAIAADAQQHWQALATAIGYSEQWMAVQIGGRVGFIRADLVTRS